MSITVLLSFRFFVFLFLHEAAFFLLIFNCDIHNPFSISYVHHTLTFLLSGIQGSVLVRCNRMLRMTSVEVLPSTCPVGVNATLLTTSMACSIRSSQYYLLYISPNKRLKPRSGKESGQGSNQFNGRKRRRWP